MSEHAYEDPSNWDGFGAPKEQEKVTPHSIETEQALLGGVLMQAEKTLEQIDDFLLPEHFHEPIHGEIYRVCLELWRRGRTPTPITVSQYFETNDALKEIGGTPYLAKLAGMGVMPNYVRDYAHVILDLALRRGLIEITSETEELARNASIDLTPRQIVEQAETALMRLSGDDLAKTGPRMAASGAALALASAERAFQGGEVVGMQTGFPSVDQLIGSLDSGALLVLAGGTSMGKTALGLNICLNNAMAGKSVGIFSLEMTEEQLARRLISCLSGIPINRIKSGKFSEADYAKMKDAEQTLSGLKLWVDPTRDLSTAQIRSRARRMKRQHGLDLLMVDYLQLVTPDNPKDRRDLQIGQITRDLVRIGGELGCNPMALSQLSRDFAKRDDKRPKLFDLKESGSIEQDARAVIFVHRQEYYLQRDQSIPNWHDEMDRWAGKAEVIIAKNSESVGAGTATLNYQGALTRFEEPESETLPSDQEAFAL